MVKCLPVSRRKSISRRCRSQSALLRSLAALAPSKARKRASCRPRACAFRSISSGARIGRSFRFPLGSPTIPVPPPTRAIGVWPKRWSQASPMTGTRLPTWSESAVGSNPMYAVTGPAARRASRPGVASCRKPRASSVDSRSVIAANRIRWNHASQPASLRYGVQAFRAAAPAAPFLPHPADHPRFLLRGAGRWAGSAGGGLGTRLRRQHLPLDRRARRVRSQSGVQGLRRRWAAHHRPRTGATYRRAAGRDVARGGGGLRLDRGQALLRASRDRLVPLLRGGQE